MTTWIEFTKSAPRISAIFLRRHTATKNLCLLATTRADGYPRISPLEPRLFEDELWLVGMPDTRKFDDLRRDPRFCLHTATVDTQVSDGDAKLFGVVRDVRDEDLQQRWAQALYDETGFDLRGHTFDPFFAADITGASAVEVGDDYLEVIIWKPDRGEYSVRKHGPE
ncbi:pyridoxamine 5'-phosphate oxidase family protein [Nocardia transvalensis]|uniref:pyridoxamine 5'-phosphate oxidase family protein n=1 Tax=Nocardia transvalensis TaxID=37333 RepID=UPI0018952C89|nr:pyridoxamine 5'-phosphate oxidase family protein [Nocardia transvalensis]MBF6331238.1 pyridoxamine 5'-phosphate oxidase family protein [Nocardia transvalensis]